MTRTDGPQPYTATHPPSWFYLDADLGPRWTVVWVWPEKTTVGEALGRHCPHRHRSMAAAIRCGTTRCKEMR